jgi:hypothetical protein
MKAQLQTPTRRPHVLVPQTGREIVYFGFVAGRNGPIGLSWIAFIAGSISKSMMKPEFALTISFFCFSDFSLANLGREKLNRSISRRVLARARPPMVPSNNRRFGHHPLVSSSPVDDRSPGKAFIVETVEYPGLDSILLKKCGRGAVLAIG